MSKPPRTHAYLADALPGDHHDEVPCICGLPKINRAHELPPTDTAVTEAEARRLGESE